MLLGQVFSSAVAEPGAEVGKGTRYSTNSRHVLDVYRPSSHVDRGPIAIFYYGGGWTSGDSTMYGFVGAALASRGITTVIPNYRLFPEVTFPEFIDDAAQAYGWVANNIANSRGARRPIVLVGHSAGAYIAAMLAFDKAYLSKSGGRSQAPSALISLAGPLSFDPTVWPSTKFIFATAATNPTRARPSELVRANAPPTLLMHGNADTVVALKNSYETRDALRRYANDVSMIEYPRVGHIGIVTAIARPLRWRAAVLDDIMKFFAREFPQRQSDTATQCLDVRADCGPAGR